MDNWSPSRTYFVFDAHVVFSDLLYNIKAVSEGATVGIIMPAFGSAGLKVWIKSSHQERM